MPQVDLETLVCGGSSNDRKIACEPIPDNDAYPVQQDPPSDFPAESYLVSKEDEYDWFDRNVFFDRNESTKGNSFSTSTISLSKRYVSKLKSKASILGLPKVQKSNYLDGKIRRNCRPPNDRIFPKRSRSYGKSNVPMSEPGSPKVSCIGRVRSKKDRSRRLRLQRLAKAKQTVSPVTKSDKAGLWRKVKTALNLGRRKQQSVAVDKQSSSEKPKIVGKKIETSEKIEPPAELTGLGGLKRFTSGRRADSWRLYDVDLDLSESDSPNGESVWSRRGVGPPIEVNSERDWECVGPASV